MFLITNHNMQRKQNKLIYKIVYIHVKIMKNICFISQKLEKVKLTYNKK